MQTLLLAIKKTPEALNEKPMVFANRLADSIVNRFYADGSTTPVDLYADLEILKTAIDKAQAMLKGEEPVECDGVKEVNNFVREYLDRSVEAEQTYHGVKFTKKETGVKYDFTDSKEWMMSFEHLTRTKNEHSALEKSLKQLGRCRKTSRESFAAQLGK